MDNLPPLKKGQKYVKCDAKMSREMLAFMNKHMNALIRGTMVIHVDEFGGGFTFSVDGRKCKCRAIQNLLRSNSQNVASSFLHCASKGKGRRCKNVDDLQSTNAGWF